MNDFSIEDLRHFINAFDAYEHVLINNYMSKKFESVEKEQEVAIKLQEDIDYCNNKVKDFKILLDRKQKEQNDD